MLAKVLSCSSRGASTVHDGWFTFYRCEDHDVTDFYETSAALDTNIVWALYPHYTVRYGEINAYYLRAMPLDRSKTAYTFLARSHTVVTFTRYHCGTLQVTDMILLPGLSSRFCWYSCCLPLPRRALLLLACRRQCVERRIRHWPDVNAGAGTAANRKSGIANVPQAERSTPGRTHNHDFAPDVASV